MKSISSLAVVSVLLVVRIAAWSADASKIGETQILKWKDGRKAAFILAFDDGAPSQLKNVVPQLEKRKLVGTFYLVTGNKLYAALKAQWEAVAKSPYVVVANHTFTHKGANNAEELSVEIAKQCAPPASGCQRVHRSCKHA